MKYYITTLGCKVNQYETQAIESILIDQGLIRTPTEQESDICIINTCAVTLESVRKSKQAIRKIKRMNPKAKIAVCGCLSALEPDVISSLGADIIGATGDRREFAKKIAAMMLPGTEKTDIEPESEPETEVETVQHNMETQLEPDKEHTNSETSVKPGMKFEELLPGATIGRTRALLKIQDGCDNYCAYCIIPYARGRSRSISPEQAAEYARQLDAGGYKEIVITGIEISSYGKDLKHNGEKSTGLEINLLDLVKIISLNAPKARYRLGSLDPTTINDEFIDELATITGLCDHFHLSLQSGCDLTLKRMGRKYDSKHILKAVSSLRKLYPNCGITADLITGFPGETDQEFDDTLQLIRAVAFSDMHIFPYSPRPGTRAATMPDQIAKSIRLERARAAAEVASAMANEFRSSQIGKVVDVLFERVSGGYHIGHSGNYIEVAVKQEVAKNSLHKVLIKSVDENGKTLGELLIRN